MNISIVSFLYNLTRNYPFHCGIFGTLLFLVGRLNLRRIESLGASIYVIILLELLTWLGYGLLLYLIVWFNIEDKIVPIGQIIINLIENISNGARLQINIVTNGLQINVIPRNVMVVNLQNSRENNIRQGQEQERRQMQNQDLQNTQS